MPDSFARRRSHRNLGKSIVSLAALAFIANGTSLAQLTPPTTITSGATKGAVYAATGDFNKDGKADLAVTNIADNTVSIFLGNGDGTFQPQVSYATGAAPLGVTVADLNLDGNPDLAVANGGANTISILLGTGTGTFGPQAAYTVGTTAAPEPFSIAVGSFAFNDAGRDLAVCNYAEGTVTQLQNNGSGQFTLIGNASAGKNPTQVLYTGNGGQVTPNSASRSIAVTNAFDGNVSYLGFGFAAALYPSGSGISASSGAGTIPYEGIVGDFNADGRSDLAIVNTGENNVSILFGVGGAARAPTSFQAPVSYLAGNGPTSVALLNNFNGTGLQALAVANSTDNTISILVNGTGAAAGTFTQTEVIPAAGDITTPYFQLYAADFNGDGVPDLAATHFGGNQVSILLGQKSF